MPGTHESAFGCAGTWDPACPQAQLSYDDVGQVWSVTVDVPAGEYAFKAAIDNSWAENYGEHAVRNGANLGYRSPGGPVTFYYDHRTHWIATDAATPIITAPGSYQTHLGCPVDWAPEALSTWLQDPDGDGIFTFSTAALPAGDYEFKIAHGRSWAENYGSGGAPNGSNVPVHLPRDGSLLTIAYHPATHALAVSTYPGPDTGLELARAVWVRADLIAWPPGSAATGGVDPSRISFRLHSAPGGGLAAQATEIVTDPTLPSSQVIELTAAGTVGPDVVAQHPELNGYLALRVDAGVGTVDQLLRGQLAVSGTDPAGRVVAFTGVQIPYVLDDLYADTARTARLGVTFVGSVPRFAVWAPTAHLVDLLTWPAGSPVDAPLSAATRSPMTRDDASGVWTAHAGERNWRYLYEVSVVAPSTGRVERNLVTDPYSVALTLNSTRSVALDLSDPAFMPDQWRTTPSPPLDQFVDSTIYELHVRDFSIADASVEPELRGSYLAFTQDGQGRRHLRALAAAGLNSVHLLPTFDIATIQEDRARQAIPAGDLAAFAPDSTEQQARIEAVRHDDGFNWGYDPWHYFAPEGSYASSAATADGGARVAEFRAMVGALHADGLRVIADQVFNHTPAAGQHPFSVLDRIVPGYYHRLSADGVVENSTCCANTATEHAMAGKLMVDAVVSWARHYRLDGFRFDLMGHHSRQNLLAVRAALDALSLDRDGVDGAGIYLYGEGWNFGEVANNARFVQASQGQLAGTGIGTFSDRLRDAVRGGGPFDADPRTQGFGSGLGTDPNDAHRGDAADPADAARLQQLTDIVALGLAGNLARFRFVDSSGRTVSGAEVDYNGSRAGYASSPEEVVSYVDAHDNETLFDALMLKLPVGTSMPDRVRMNTLCLALVLLGQSPAFLHAGTDLLRSKSGDRNSYDSGDWFNAIDWTGADNGFGHGLPRAGDNEAKWPYLRPLLGQPGLKPSADDVANAHAGVVDLLRLRFSTPLFRLGSAEVIQAKVGFPVNGTPTAIPGVLVMHIDDTQGVDADPALRRVVVVVNARPEPVSQLVPSLRDVPLQLSAVQRSGADPVVAASSWSPVAALATVPARTVAVFVEPG